MSFEIEHIALAERANVVVIAPATANIIAKLAAGIADDMLTCTVLATRAPVILAPAMNVNMWENRHHPGEPDQAARPGIQDGRTGDSGSLACGAQGKGRLADVEDILTVISQALRVKDGPGRQTRGGQRRRHAGADRPGALRRQPQLRQDGLRPGRGGARPRRRGDPDHRPDGPR